MRARAWALGALCWAVLGCSPRPPRVGEPAPALSDSTAERAYLRTLERFTAHREVYSMFDTRMLAATTYQAPSFRVARVKRKALFQALPPDTVSRLLADEEHEADQFHDFVLGVHVNLPQFDDFDRKSSVWRVVLVTEAGQLLPLSIERIGRANVELRAYYPYLDDFWTAYRIRFPKLSAAGQPLVPPGTKAVVLRVASSLGMAEFSVPLE